MLKTILAVTLFALFALAQDPADAPVAAPAAGRGGGGRGGRGAPRAPVRETVTLADGQKLEGIRVGEGMDDHQIRTDDGRIHLLRRTAGTPVNGTWREVTSTVNWPS